LKPGLPDGTFVSQKIQIWCISEGLGMETFGTFMVLWYFMAIWSILRPFGIYFPFWYVECKKNLATLFDTSGELWL
jgi:hypothetical protein